MIFSDMRVLSASMHCLQDHLVLYSHKSKLTLAFSTSADKCFTLLSTECLKASIEKSVVPITVWPSVLNCCLAANSFSTQSLDDSEGGREGGREREINSSFNVL